MSSLSLCIPSSHALLSLCSEIDFTLAGLETLARVFDPPVSPRSPAREQVIPVASSQCGGYGWF